VRRTSIISALLILVFTTSASACISGWSTPSADSCSPGLSHPHCPRKQSVRPVCGQSVKPLPAKCGLRSFTQFHFIAFHPLETRTPLRCVARSLAAATDAVIIVSSIGSPETDRGPPRS